MVIGLTGLNASGKGEVARILCEGGFEYFSLSDELRAIMREHGVQPTRDMLIEWGRKVRADLGADVLARRVVAKFTPGVNQVVDSVRNSGEVRCLREQPDFFLVAVEADSRVRFERLRLRSRTGDPQTFEEFVELERRELGSTDPAAQQLWKTIQMAEFVVRNDGTLEDLRGEVVRVFKEAAARLKRPSWDEYFMRIAWVVASRSSCVKRRAAAVIVRDRRIISTGYNGTPTGTRNCNEGGCPRCLGLAPSGASLGECLCSHAEENAIVQASLHGVSVRGATMYTTFSPCLICTKMIINAGIAEVVYRNKYPISDTAMELLREAGIKLRQV